MIEPAAYPAETHSTEKKTLIIDLGDLTPSHRGLAGTKSINEAVLKKAGFLVPDGFVLTARAFERFLEEKRKASIDDSGTVPDATMPLDIKDALENAVAALGSGPLAVRSSAVAEDLPGASFAGQYETVLNVQGSEQLVTAVHRCWNSAFNGRVISYREQQGIGIGPMAVLIQRMIPADAAGVAFTVNPVSGARDEVIINAVRGLGERLVSGTALADEWSVRGEQARCLQDPEKAIGEEQAKAIADMARQVEKHFGAPQDIEWALADGQLYILQARFITALPKETPEMIPMPIEVPPGYWEHDASHFPEPIYPMNRLLLEPLKVAVKNWVEDFGYLFDGLEVVEIGGWAYERIAPLGGKEGPPLPKPLMWLLVRVVPMLRRRLRQAKETMRTDKPGRYVRQWYEEHQPDLARRISELLEIDLASLSDNELVRHIDATNTLWAQGIEVHTYAHASLAIILYQFVTTCEELLEWDMAKTFTLVDGTSFKSTEPARRLHELAQMAKERPQVLALLDQIDVSTMERLVAEDKEFAEAFAAYVYEFGHRVLNEISEPTLAETPWLLLGQIRSQILRGYDPLADQLALAEKRETAASEAREILKNRPEDLARFEKALERAKLAYPVREDNHYFTGSAPFALIRYAILELGMRLVTRGMIEKRDDVFYLELEEASAGLANAAHPSARMDLYALISRRKAERTWAVANPGPPSYGEEPPPPPDLSFLPSEARLPMEAMLWSMDSIFALESSSQTQRAGSTLKGIAASAGEYTGPARIIMNESEFHRLQPGDVLVCPITSPVWSILFPSVGALVTDSGGTLSHPAIIAREYQVPAVVALGNATSVLKDGQLVRVDGAAGTVTNV